MSKWIVDIHGEIEGDYELICKAESIIPLDKVKQAKEEMAAYIEPATGQWTSGCNNGVNTCIEILDNLIAEGEEK